MAELSLDSHNPVGSETAEGHRRLSWEDVCSTFDTLCLSWNPALFPHIITHHRYGIACVISIGPNISQYMEGCRQEEWPLLDRKALSFLAGVSP